MISKLFNDVTDAIYVRICLILASSLLAVLGVISPTLWGVCIQQLEKNITEK